MKKSFISGSMLAIAVVVTSPLAYSDPYSDLYNDPGNGMQVDHMRDSSEYVFGRFCDTNHVCYSFKALDWIDKKGPGGSVVAWYYLEGTYPVIALIACDGRDFVSPNGAGIGNVRIKATLDPASPNCVSEGSEPVSGPISIDLVGQAGSYQESEIGTGKVTDLGESYKYNFQEYHFSETFTGTNGFYSGTFSGTATIRKRVEQLK